MSNKELLPCPFCGGKAKLWRTEDSFDSNGWYSEVICQYCNARIIGNEDEAINAWNTRVDVAKSDECCEKSCKEECEAFKPLIPKWFENGDDLVLNISVMHTSYIEFEITKEENEYRLTAFLKSNGRYCNEEDGGHFKTIKEAKAKANEYIKWIGERLVCYADKIRTIE